MAKQINPIDAVLPHISAAVAEWQTTHNQEVIRNRIHKMLDKESEQITFKLLGFNQSYKGDWELDHCNGRAGNSAAGEFIKTAQQAAIKEWLSAIPLPEIKPSLMAKLKREMNDVYAHNLLTKVRELATTKASNDMNALLNKIIPSQDIEKYLQTMKLLSPND